MSSSTHDPFDDAISRLQLFQQEQRSHQANIQRWWGILVNDWRHQIIDVTNAANLKLSPYNFRFLSVEQNNKMGTDTQLVVEALGPSTGRDQHRISHPKLVFKLEDSGEALITVKVSGADFIPERRLAFDDPGSKAMLAGILAEYAEAAIRRASV